MEGICQKFKSVFIPRKVGLLILDKLSRYITSDEWFIKTKYHLKMGDRLNLQNPQTYTEKLQWLKLYDRQPIYPTLVDKYAVKDYVAKAIGEEYVIPTLGVWDSFDDIDFSVLGNKFVLKTTHAGGSSGVVICNDISDFDYKSSRNKLQKSLGFDTYWVIREWPYKMVKHRIIAEKLLECSDGDLKDYKFFCFNGEPKVLLVASNRFTVHNFNYFDMDFNDLPITSRDGPRLTKPIPKPQNFEKMIEIAKTLSTNIPHVRVDLYNVEGKIYFGELTLYDSSGYDNLSSEKWNKQFGSWLTLPEEKTCKH